MDYSKYDGYCLIYDQERHIKEKSYYCHNYYRGFDGEEIFAHSDDDNYTEYSINGIPFAESFTSEEDVMHVYSEFKKVNHDN